MNTLKRKVLFKIAGLLDLHRERFEGRTAAECVAMIKQLSGVSLSPPQMRDIARDMDPPISLSRGSGGKGSRNGSSAHEKLSVLAKIVRAICDDLGTEPVPGARDLLTSIIARKQFSDLAEPDFDAETPQEDK